MLPVEALPSVEVVFASTGIEKSFNHSLPY
nr:MAG TPA: hypothetical protein [Caudoviricetes sp.]